MPSGAVILEKGPLALGPFALLASSAAGTHARGRFPMDWIK